VRYSRNFFILQQKDQNSNFSGCQESLLPPTPTHIFLDQIGFYLSALLKFGYHPSPLPNISVYEAQAPLAGLKRLLINPNSEKMENKKKYG
jgi:hypothetical protein